MSMIVGTSADIVKMNKRQGRITVQANLMSTVHDVSEKCIFKNVEPLLRNKLKL